MRSRASPRKLSSLALVNLKQFPMNSPREAKTDTHEGTTSGATPRGRLPRVLYALVLEPGLKFGTLEEQMVHLGKAFAAEGSIFFPLFLCPKDPEALRAFTVHGIAADCLDLQRFRLGRLRTLLHLLRRLRIDLIHWNFTNPLMNSYIWGLKALAPRVRHFFTDHNSRHLPLPPPPHGLNRWLKKRLLKRYERVWCVSQFVQKCLEHQATWSNLTTCLHFVNTERFRPDPMVRTRVRQDLNADESLAAITVAHLIEDKGIDVAIQALARLPEKVSLWVIGGGDQASALDRLIADLGLVGRVRRLGPQANVQPFLQAADCFVCPSRWAEAAGLVNLEALACGLPVVASRIGGIPEYVIENQTGLLFQPGDADELAGCLRRLAREPDLRQRLGKAARTDALARFSVPARLPEWLELYRTPSRANWPS